MRKVKNFRFTAGEVYAFSKTRFANDLELPIFGVYFDTQDGRVVLESMTSDNMKFQTWCTLPEQYSYIRRAKHAEIRDFSFNCCYYELTNAGDR